MHQHCSQFVHDSSATAGLSCGRVLRAVRAEIGAQVELDGEGNVACELDEVRPEALQMESEGVGGCVDVQ